MNPWVVDNSIPLERVIPLIEQLQKERRQIYEERKNKNTPF
jgi:hypothetical protein